MPPKTLFDKALRTLSDCGFSLRGTEQDVQIVRRVSTAEKKSAVAKEVSGVSGRAREQAGWYGGRENGFITMIIMMILVIGTVVFLAYLRVKSKNG